eukprot:snap_masked-scaffold_45-processed-gene-1.66-mRNA-1 protein AED:1.00 eAED:1.00 QI:0/-1/0/0/-1/1/1/0/145
MTETADIIGIALGVFFGLLFLICTIHCCYYGGLAGFYLWDQFVAFLRWFFDIPDPNRNNGNQQQNNATTANGRPKELTWAYFSTLFAPKNPHRYNNQQQNQNQRPVTVNQPAAPSPQVVRASNVQYIPEAVPVAESIPVTKVNNV